jgi:FMN-dependent oxidoreductase (nitrilotriacetate monooxygenase family)
LRADKAEGAEVSVLHFGWFVGKGYSPHGWNQRWTGAVGIDWMAPDLYLDLARAMDRSCFDYLLIEDGSFIADAFQGSPDWYLEHAFAVPKNDPLPLVPLLGQATTHLGIVATVTTTFYPPYLAARLGATLDHLTHGRVGFNLVTAHNDRTAQNFGLDKMYEHDLRYEIADEWMEVCDRLWNSWEPGAIVADPQTGVFADPSKIHPINFEGRFFKCRGPLNTAPGPQRRPVICQAGGSPAGRAFAAKHADTIIGKARNISAAKRYRDDVHMRMKGFGRDPGDCKVLFGTSIVLGETMDEARERKARYTAALADNMDARLAGMSFLTGIDFSKFALDEPLPDIKTNASQSAFAAYLGDGGTRTLRETLLDQSSGNIDFLGTPDSVAAEIGEMMQEIGGDGFLVTDPLTRRAISEITDGLAPALKRRGLMRSAYEHKLFRDNLLAF